jgi:2-polyprenyl-3-methyl-5-hydroxy-6-metoxy-1,4-benzoquinol methylase
MIKFDNKEHWDTIYTTKELSQVSWYQPIPETSLKFIEELAISKSAKIIDIGGGDSFLADHLLALGFTDLTVLDISESAINRAKKRLGEKAKLVTWIVSDITTFEPREKFDFWHDRAAFHFLTDLGEISKYLKIAKQYINSQSYMVVGTFSETGPKKCSGIEIKQYGQTALKEQFKEGFKNVKCVNVDHKTPSLTTQNFTFCSFMRE